MQTADIQRIRLHNQLLNGSRFTRPEEIVSYMGAMQSQAVEMAKWGVGLRLPGATIRSIDEAIDSGKIIRTHILRPTWHFVSAADIHWMLDLSIPRIKPIFESYCRMINVDEALIIRGLQVVERVLEGHNYLTRQEIADHIKAEGMTVDNHIVNQIMSRAEIERIVCNGRQQGGKQTYALLDEWVPRQDAPDREASLERLARAFFTSHAPATLQDFVWWSGMLTSDARKAIDAISSDFVSETVNGRTFYFHKDTQMPTGTESSALLLPAFDEFVVSYKDREEILEKEHHRKIITRTGIFSPTIMYDGRVIGSWKKAKKGIDMFFFNEVKKEVRLLFGETEQLYNAYLGR